MFPVLTKSADNAQMVHSDIINWGKNILLLQKKHMMTNYKGGIQDSALGVVLATLIVDTHACFDGHPYVKVYIPYTNLCFIVATY